MIKIFDTFLFLQYITEQNKTINKQNKEQNMRTPTACGYPTFLAGG